MVYLLKMVIFHGELLNKTALLLTLSPLSITPLHHPSPSPLSIWHHLCFQLFQVPPCPSHSFSTTSGRCRKCSRYPTSGNPCEPDKGSHSLRDAKQTATTDKGNIWKYHSKMGWTVEQGMPRLLDHHKIIFGEGLSIQTGFHHLKGYVRVPTWTLSPHLVVHRQQHHRQHSTSTKFRPLVTVWVQHKNLKKNMLILSWTSRKTNSWLKEKNRVHCVHLPSSLSDQMIPSKAAVLKTVGQSSAGMICEKLLGSLVVKKTVPILYGF